MSSTRCEEGRGRSWSAALLSVACIAAACLGGLAATAGSAHAARSARSGGSVDFPVFFPFSGPDADYGFYAYAGCPPAVNGINAAGGILGRTAKCTIVDTRGDPADAVSAARKLIGTDSSIGGIVGPSSDEDTATVPVFTDAKIVTMDEGGTSLFNKQTSPYYWRTTPPDALAGLALAIWAKERGLTNGAAVFSNDNAAQGNVPGLVKAAKVLGLRITVNIALAPDQTSYQNEVQRVLASHPQAIFTETDPQTAGVFFKELKAVGGLRPVIGTAGIVGPDYNKAVSHAVGAADFRKDWVIIQPYGAVSGPTWKPYDTLLLASGKQLKNPKQFANQVYTELPYDDINIMALAMLAAKSVTPADYNKFIPAVTQPRRGAVVVHSFAAGKKALAAGKKIEYVGPTGVVAFDKYHNSPGEFSASIPAENYKIAGIITAPKVNAVKTRAGL